MTEEKEGEFKFFGYEAIRKKTGRHKNNTIVYLPSDWEDVIIIRTNKKKPESEPNKANEPD